MSGFGGLVFKILKRETDTAARLAVLNIQRAETAHRQDPAALWNGRASQTGTGSGNRQRRPARRRRLHNLAHLFCGCRGKRFFSFPLHAGSIFQEFGGRNGCGSHRLFIRQKHRAQAASTALQACYSWIAWDTALLQTLRTPPTPFIPVTPARLLEDKRSLAAVIDHTLLKPEATSAEIEKLCEEALAYGFASVCINPCWVRLARERVAAALR